MNLASLRASTCFKLNPMQVGPNDDAFLGFLNFAFGQSDEAIEITNQFVIARGEYGPLADASIPSEAGKFIDWLILNHWGEGLTPTSQGETNE